jgi:hypothetical protein
VPPTSADEEERHVVLVDVKHRLRKSMTHFRTLEIDTLLQAEILAELIDGPRSSTELVERILHTDRSNPREFEASCARVRRGLKNLGARGYVSRGLLRRNSPHRLTRYAVARLADIQTGYDPERIVTRATLCLLSGSVITGILSLMRYAGILVLGRPVTGTLFAFFFLFTGATLTRLVDSLRRLM